MFKHFLFNHTQVEIIAQTHERDVDRKDAILQMLDRDLDEAEEQHQMAVRTHLQNIGKFVERFATGVVDIRRTPSTGAGGPRIEFVSMFASVPRLGAKQPQTIASSRPTDTLCEIQEARLQALEKDYGDDVCRVEGDWKREKEDLTKTSEQQKAELRNIIDLIAQEDKAQEQVDITEHQQQYELIRNKNIEEDHQMR